MEDYRKDLKSPYYTTPEAAEFCRRSPNTMKQYRTSGGGPVYFRRGGKSRVHQGSLDRMDERLSRDFNGLHAPDG